MAESGEPLSSREQEIVKLVATGVTNRMIARDLGISPNTVKVHLRNIFTKLDVASRTEATMYAVSQGWVAVPESEGGVEAAGEQDVYDPGPIHAPLPPMFWPQRVYLVASLVAALLITWLAWPATPEAPAETCANEFTAECTTAGGEVSEVETESLWVSAEQLPQAAGRFAVAGLDGRVYVIGGETESGVVGSVLVYDRQSDQWTSGSDKSTPAANVTAVVLDDLIYVPGGSTADGTPLEVVEVYDPAADRWSQVAPLPGRRTAVAATAYDGKLYVLGGWDGAAYSGDVVVYDPQSDRWQTLPSMPTARGFAGAAAVSDQIMVIGGYDGRREYALCEQFDPAANAWSRCPSMSTPRGGLGVAVVAGQVYAIGGGWDSFVTFSERYNPHAGRWQNIETPLLLAGGEWRNLGVAALGTQVYALGGWQNGRYLTVNQAYETLPNRLYLPATAGQ